MSRKCSVSFLLCQILFFSNYFFYTKILFSTLRESENIPEMFDHVEFSILLEKITAPNSHPSPKSPSLPSKD